MTLAEERREAALGDAQDYIELLRVGSSEGHAFSLLQAAQTIYACEREMQQEAELLALAKEMSPKPTVRVMIRNAFGGGQFVDMPIDHPALKV